MSGENSWKIQLGILVAPCGEKFHLNLDVCSPEGPVFLLGLSAMTIAIDIGSNSSC